MARICFFVGDLNNAGGTERVSSVIANELHQRGYQVHMLSLQCGDKPFFELAKGIEISQLFTTVGRGVLRLPIAVTKLRRYLKVHQIDILIDVESMLALYALPALMGLNIRHICWEHFFYHNDLGKYSRRIARKLAARYADDVVTLTERDKQFWLANTTCRANITAIPNPMTIEKPNKIDTNKEKIFLAVGRLTNIKGFDLLLQSWARVAPFHPDWSLRIVGDGEDKAILEQLCHDLNITSSTEFAGKTNNVAAHYQQAAFFVLSSRFEGLPLVLIEAQAFGLPAISFDCDTGPSEIIQQEITGWLCQNLDIKSLSDQLDLAIDIFNNKDLYSRYQINSVVNAQRFCISEVSELWCKNILNE
ncbi:glycosyltransferase family 4 protein [Vibrio cholerae]|uniref:glycosyltransferase family 4 protein n=1 Tax=Vibrio cholerae TaxID=666 RepID=UPI000F41C933|nr:glycosyltransferase family 4 protein [Vibrio cholerae]NOE83721.1 glycosyltransferase family 4 protein [Vibrio cholerae]NOE95196.1 glycosyltransferase family 4 protein [Vibrio cholerae]NOE99903.1 glycosyltransferase family 4 protein [Vibrio cholerae]NOF12906.1 glycosyltransferase family 4 protein [Vibrio cholerae]NOF15816.1 glycosyltransferase family 4 protein [Vibrio cholerae]